MSVTITFGKYKGRDIESVDSDYLVWILGNFDKSHWLTASREELIRRGHAKADPVPPDANDQYQTLLVTLPGERQKRIRVGSKAGMPVQVTHPDDPPPPRESPFYGSLDTTELPLDMMRRFGKLNVAPILSNPAIEDGMEEFPADLAVLNKDVVQAMATLSTEAALYGVLEEAKWNSNKTKCEVTITYLGKSWLFQMGSNCKPTVVKVAKI